MAEKEGVDGEEGKAHRRSFPGPSIMVALETYHVEAPFPKRGLPGNRPRRSRLSPPPPSRSSIGNRPRILGSAAPTTVIEMPKRVKVAKRPREEAAKPLGYERHGGSTLP